jgi:hypothetical protein
MSRSTTTNQPTLADRLRKVNEHRESLVKVLAPCRSDWALGGAHRMWVIECALLTARAYIEESKALETALADQCALARRNGQYAALTSVWHLPIPMPPAWGGERPAECSTYGHSATAWKDWRHFENALRYYLAREGYLGDTASVNKNKEIAFQARRMMDVAMIGLGDIKAEAYEGKPTFKTASTPPDYKAFCDSVDEHYEALARESDPE